MPEAGSAVEARDAFLRLGRLTRAASRLTPRSILFFCLVAVAIGGGLGRLLLHTSSSLGLVDPATAVRRSSLVFLILGFAIIVVTHLTVERISQDHQSGWPMVVFARGLSRRAYLCWVFLNALMVGLAVHVSGTSAFLAATGQWPLSTDVMGYVVWKGPLAILSFGSLALLVSVLSRRASRAVLILILITAGPYLAYSLLALAHLGGEVALSTKLALLWHLPPFSLSGRALLHHAGYSVMATSLALWLAPRLFIRYE